MTLQVGHQLLVAGCEPGRGRYVEPTVLRCELLDGIAQGRQARVPDIRGDGS